MEKVKMEKTQKFDKTTIRMYTLFSKIGPQNTIQPYSKILYECILIFGKNGFYEITTFP